MKNKMMKKRTTFFLLGLLTFVAIIATGCPQGGSKVVPDPTPTPTPDLFSLVIEEVFTITGKGTVVTGRVASGVCKVGDKVHIVGFDKTLSATVTGLEMFHKTFEEVQKGDNCGMLVDIDKTELEKGMVVCTPDTLTNKKKFTANIYVLTKDEGGRSTPFLNYYRPQVTLYGTDITGHVTFDGEIMMPGSSGEVTILLAHSLALKDGQEFLIRESGKTIAKGTIKNILALDKFPNETAFLVTSTDNSFTSTVVTPGETFVPKSFAQLKTIKISLSGDGASIKYPTWTVVAGNNDTYFDTAHTKVTAINKSVSIYPLDTAESDFLTGDYGVKIECKDETGNSSISFFISAK